MRVQHRSSEEPLCFEQYVCFEQPRSQSKRSQVREVLAQILFPHFLHLWASIDTHPVSTRIIYVPFNGFSEPFTIISLLTTMLQFESELFLVACSLSNMWICSMKTS